MSIRSAGGSDGPPDPKSERLRRRSLLGRRVLAHHREVSQLADRLALTYPTAASRLAALNENYTLSVLDLFDEETER